VRLAHAAGRSHRADAVLAAHAADHRHGEVEMR
jgi:hypothetical protein